MYSSREMSTIEAKIRTEERTERAQLETLIRTLEAQLKEEQRKKKTVETVEMNQISQVRVRQTTGTG